LDFVEEYKTFDIEAYKNIWLKNMQTYKGYIDGACKDTIQIISNDASAVFGSSSHDLSIVGRIAPLLYVSETKEEFLSNVKGFVSFTHNNSIVLNVASLFGNVLYDVTNGVSIEDALATAQVSKEIQEAFNAGIASKGKETFTCIQEFGSACSVEGGFEGTLHLLVSYDDFKEAMIANAKVGGDSSARGMIVAMIMGAAGCKIPITWREDTKGV